MEAVMDHAVGKPKNRLTKVTKKRTRPITSKDDIILEGYVLFELIVIWPSSWSPG
jgi:hypothetical protein